MRPMPLSECVLDFDLYPRQQVDSHHVGEMCEARRAGTEFPPIVVDKKSKRVVDGFHRFRMEQRRGSDTIMAVEKTYKNDGAMFLDAMRFNASHGRTLTAYDRAHAVILAGNLGLNDKAVAGALSITVDRIQSLRINKSATAGNGKLARSVAIKRTIQHMAGKRLTTGQQAVNKKLGGMNTLFYVRQLIMLIKEDLIDKENEELAEGLKELKELL